MFTPLLCASSILLTQIKAIVPVDLYPEPVHVRVPLGVRVPQHLALHVQDLVALSLRVLRHVGSVPITAEMRVQRASPRRPVPTDEGSCGIRSPGYLVRLPDYSARQRAIVMWERGAAEEK